MGGRGGSGTLTFHSEQPPPHFCNTDTYYYCKSISFVPRPTPAPRISCTRTLSREIGDLQTIELRFTSSAHAHCEGFLQLASLLHIEPPEPPHF